MWAPKILSTMVVSLKKYVLVIIVLCRFYTQKGLLIDLVEVVGTALVLTFVLLIFIQPSIVDGRSMFPTLHDNDKLLLWKLGDIDRNDIVVFDSHDMENNKYVKRVIGIAGDEIIIKDSIVTVNGTVLNETYINEPSFNGDISLIVPEDEIFVLGDNREHSLDSEELGPMKKEQLKGVVIFTLFPFNEFGKLEK